MEAQTIRAWKLLRPLLGLSLAWLGGHAAELRVVNQLNRGVSFTAGGVSGSVPAKSETSIVVPLAACGTELTVLEVGAGSAGLTASIFTTADWNEYETRIQVVFGEAASVEFCSVTEDIALPGTQRADFWVNWRQFNLGGVLAMLTIGPWVMYFGLRRATEEAVE